MDDDIPNLSLIFFVQMEIFPPHEAQAVLSGGGCLRENCTRVDCKHQSVNRRGEVHRFIYEKTVETQEPTRQ